MASIRTLVLVVLIAPISGVTTLSVEHSGPRITSPEPRQRGTSPKWAAKELRAGIIGTDTSHVPQFTKMIGVYHGLLKADPTLPLIEVRGDKGTSTTSGPGGPDALVQAIAEFFHTGRSPVDVAQTIEVLEFMTAAELSKERHGAEVALAELRK